MKKFLALNAALAALLVVGSIVQAQEAVPVPTDEGAPVVADIQASPSDVIAPPTPDSVQAVQAGQAFPSVTSDCVGCAPATPYFGQAYTTPCNSGCGSVAPVYNQPIVQSAGGCCNGCGTVSQVAYQQPVMQASGCGSCGTVAQVAYQQPVVQSGSTTGIITPAMAPVVSQNLQMAAPVYSYAPATSGCAGCGTGTPTPATGVSYAPTSTYAPTTSGCAGCGTAAPVSYQGGTSYAATSTYAPTYSSVGTSSYAPVSSGCNNCGSTPTYSAGGTTGRVRTRLGGRLLRRN